MPDAPLCRCHGEPCGWQRDLRRKSGGWWECRVKRQAYNRTRTTNEARRAAITQRRRDRYDNDPIFRIGDLLRQRRYQALRRLRARHSLPKKG